LDLKYLPVIERWYYTKLTFHSVVEFVQMAIFCIEVLKYESTVVAPDTSWHIVPFHTSTYFLDMRPHFFCQVTFALAQNLVMT
jgi:hypothetical protein